MEKKKKLIRAQPLLRNAHAPGHQKRMTRCFQCYCSRRCLIFERHRTLHPKKEGASHSLALVMHMSTTFIFLIIFIFVKRMNCPSFKLKITKKNMMKIQKNLMDVNFNFLLSRIVILLCNQNKKRLKSPWILVFFFFFTFKGI